jgi:inorganic triphosphatase YgiF
MKIELEKKYNLSKEDYKIIRDNCEFIKEVSLKDYYLDKDFILSKNKYYLRLRN